jgi:hypothetical protein
MDAGQIVNLVIALITLATAILALLKVWRTNAKVDVSAMKLDNVEQLVNGNHHIALARINQLSESLTNADVAIPKAPIVEAGKGNAV